LRSQLIAGAAISIYAAARLLPEDFTPTQEATRSVASILLATGLYVSVAGIQTDKVREDGISLTLAVVFGVGIKIALLFSILSAFFSWTESAALSVIFAQVDPLSTGVVLGRSRLSLRGKNFIQAWASFDDPITTLVALAIIGTPGNFDMQEAIAVGWVATSACLLGIAALRRWGSGSQLVGLVSHLLAAGTIVLSVQFEFFFASALLGLFFRPAWVYRISGQYLLFAYLVAFGLVGVSVNRQEQWIQGFLLALLATLAHASVSAIFAQSLSRLDRVLIAAGQQSGLTALILTLTFLDAGVDVVDVAAPAILGSIVLYYATNQVLSQADGDFPLMRYADE